MAVAKMRHEWDMAANLICTIANSARDPKRRAEPFRVEEIHPFRQQTTAVDPWKIMRKLADGG
jgi:hypothetical protein